MDTTEYKQRKFAKNPVQHCWMCGCDLTYDTATVDHLRAKSKGGRNKAENFRLACKPCNGARGNRKLTPAEMAKATGRHRASASRYDELAAAIRRANA